MSSSTQLQVYPVPKEETSESSSESSFSFIFGKKIGRAFVAAKNKATDQYKKVTSGINQSIEDEEARRFAELQMILDNQANEYEGLIDYLQRTWLKRTVLYSFLALIVGVICAMIIFYFLMY